MAVQLLMSVPPLLQSFKQKEFKRIFASVGFKNQNSSPLEWMSKTFVMPGFIHFES